MLVLTRRANQSIMIGHEIVVTVLEVRGDQVRLGIKAPRSIDVHREEIFAQLQQANRDAAQAPKQAIESLDGFTQAGRRRRAKPAPRRSRLELSAARQIVAARDAPSASATAGFVTVPSSVFTPARERGIGVRSRRSRRSRARPRRGASRW